jgi:hypothetical protein
MLFLAASPCDAKPVGGFQSFSVSVYGTLASSLVVVVKESPRKRKKRDANATNTNATPTHLFGGIVSDCLDTKGRRRVGKKGKSLLEFSDSLYVVAWEETFRTV